MSLDLSQTIRKKKTTAEVISAQRWALMTESPFFATLAMYLTPVEAPWCTSNGVPTMGTEGKFLYYHPNIQDVFSEEEIKVVILHEVLHAAFRHMIRKGEREHFIWNVACDFAVNDIIAEAKYFRNGNQYQHKLPECSLYDPKYKGMSAEKVYQELMKDINTLKKTIENFPNDLFGGKGKGKEKDKSGSGNQNQAQGQNSSGSGSNKGKKKQRIIDVHIDPSKGMSPNQDGKQSNGNGQQGQSGSPGQGQGNGDADNGVPSLSKEDLDKLAREWEMRVIEASVVYERYVKTYGQGRGNMPGQIQELVDQIKRPKTNVYNLISRFMHMAVTDYTNWNLPHTKRIAATGFYMPTKKNFVMDPVIVVDTSGSIGKEDLEAIFGVIDKIIKALPVNNVRYMECDAVIHRDIIIRKADRGKGIHGMFPEPEIKDGLNVKGRGGTDFRLPFERIMKDKGKFKPSFVLYITADGNGHMPEMRKFPFRTLWLVDEDKCSDTKSFPFGAVATYDRKFIKEYSHSKDSPVSTSPSP
jgi:predicted metal-dependent peptidase